MGAELIGVTKTQQRIRRQLQSIQGATVMAVIEFLEAVIGRAAQLAPVDTGDLRGSFVLIVNGERWGHTEASGADVRYVRDRQGVPENLHELTIYAGTAGCVYALRQHEELTWRHPKGGQAKYLEAAWIELFPTLQQRLEEAKRKGAEEGGRS